MIITCDIWVKSWITCTQQGSMDTDITSVTAQNEVIAWSNYCWGLEERLFIMHQFQFINFIHYMHSWTGKTTKLFNQTSEELSFSPREIDSHHSYKCYSQGDWFGFKNGLELQTNCLKYNFQADDKVKVKTVVHITQYEAVGLQKKHL